MCAKCGRKDAPLLWDYDPVPECCGQRMERDFSTAVRAHSVIGDDIPGGIEIRHGLCNPDGTPKRYYSKTEIKEAERRTGWVNHVEHVPMRGSDKSPHTSRWV